MTIPKQILLGEEEKVFIDQVKHTCKKRGIKLLLVDDIHVLYDNWKMNGYFDPEKKTLAAATQGDFIATVVHEFCHLEQWVENKEWFESIEKDIDQMGIWLKGGEIKGDIRKHINRIRNMELDCEKRSVQKIRDFSLNVNIETYIQKANAYMLFHNYMKLSRAWDSPYEEGVWKKMPNRFMSDEWYTRLTPRVKKIFSKHLVSS